MKIKLIAGTYYATFKHRSGAVCMGYSPSLSEALTFCAELIIERDQLN